MESFLLQMCAILYMLSVHVYADYMVEVTVQSYSNPTNRAADFRFQSNQCCDQNLPGTNNDSVCTGIERCDNYFEYCLRSLGTPNTTVICLTFSRTSSTILDGGDINFSQPPVLGLPNPFTLPGLSTTWQGAQLYVEVMDNDQVDDDLVDTFSIDINTEVGSSAQFTRVGRFGLGTLSVSVRVLCLPGFSGIDCGTNIDDCVGINCSFQGICSDLVNDYMCDCFEGFTGRDCEENIDDCVGVSCNGRGNCHDLVNNYVCLCRQDSGFTGRDCEVNTDDCVGQECSGNGQCNDLVNSFQCECLPGFTGPLCQINIDDCVGANCTNGQCMDGIDFFSCDCEPGYTGDFCSVEIEGQGSINTEAIVVGVVGLLLIIAAGLVILGLVCKRVHAKTTNQAPLIVPPVYDNVAPQEQPTYDYIDVELQENIKMKPNVVYGTSKNSTEHIEMNTNMVYGQGVCV